MIVGFKKVAIGLAYGLLLSILGAAHATDISKLDFDHTFQRSQMSLEDSEDEQIDPHVGSLRLTYVDLNLPGNGGMDLKVVRAYDSGRVAQFGQAFLATAPYTPQPLGWTIHYGRLLVRYRKCDAGGNVNYMPLLEMPDGTRRLGLSVQESGYSAHVTADRWSIECTADGYLVKAPDGMKYYMEYAATPGPYRCALPDGSDDDCNIGAYYTTKIVDPRGNYAAISYKEGCVKSLKDDGFCEPIIQTVTANDGRQLIFKYKVVSTSDETATRWQIEQVTSSAGQYVKYELQNLNQVGGRVTALVGVVTSAGYSWKYSYHVPRYLTDARCSFQIQCDPDGWDLHLRQVVGPFGGTRDYAWTYVPIYRPINHNDPAPVGLKTKTVNGADVWNYSYQLVNSDYIKTITTISGPDGTRVYHHLADRYLGGFHGLSSSEWRAGLLIYSEVVGQESVEYTWAGQPLTNDWANVVPLSATWYWDLVTPYSPVMTKRRIVRNAVEYVEEYSGFDAFGRPTTTTQGPSSGPRKSTVRSFWSEAGNWMLDRVVSETTTLQ